MVYYSLLVTVPRARDNNEDSVVSALTPGRRQVADVPLLSCVIIVRYSAFSGLSLMTLHLPDPGFQGPSDQRPPHPLFFLEKLALFDFITNCLPPRSRQVACIQTLAIHERKPSHCGAGSSLSSSIPRGGL